MLTRWVWLVAPVPLRQLHLQNGITTDRLGSNVKTFANFGEFQHFTKLSKYGVWNIDRIKYGGMEY